MKDPTPNSGDEEFQESLFGTHEDYSSPTNSPENSGKLTPSQIGECLGVDAVLLPIKKGSKAPTRAGWQETTFQATQTLRYQKSLENAPSVGVLLGMPSQGLISIDFDCEEALLLFLSLNPIFESTYRTTARRGQNVWLIIKGDIPKSSRLKDAAGKAIGEWRAKGNHTIITGEHEIKGYSYKAVCSASPLVVSFESIRWPEGWTTPSLSSSFHFSSQSAKSSQSTYSSKSESSTPSTVLHDTSLVTRIDSASKARKKLHRKRDLNLLFKKFVEQRFTPRQGERNIQLTAMVTFLFHAVSLDRLRVLTLAFYETNADIFNDSIEDHLKERDAHLDRLISTYPSTLSEEERSVFEGLPPAYQDTFRICRDLASRNDKDGVFFLSSVDLGRRIARDQRQAHRILLTLDSLCLKTVLKGTRRTKGNKGRATTYKWILGPLPKPQTTQPPPKHGHITNPTNDPD